MKRFAVLLITVLIPMIITGSVSENELLDQTYRVDIKTLSLEIDYYPSEYYAHCVADIRFYMRKGQKKPVIHLNPGIRDRNSVSTFMLNGETLNAGDDSMVRVISFEGTRQQAFEIQRELAEDVEHRLQIVYRLNLTRDFQMMVSQVSDLYGRGNEEVWPTLNSHEEMLTHKITFNVHGTVPFRCIGSGVVTQLEGSDVMQRWELNTVREVPSNTVMFVLIPASVTKYEERVVDGVKVKIMSFTTNNESEQAFSRLETWMPQLRRDLGAFPMPELSIFLMSHGGGMEYYGATITSLWALEHEIFHMYYGCSTIMKTYRDSWIDEAVNEWYETQRPVIPSTYVSDIVSGRSAIGLGFDSRAYWEGALIMEAVARELGGRDQMISFLKHIQDNHAFKPFSTQDFLKILQDYSGVDMYERFNQWLYYTGSQSGTYRKADKKIEKGVIRVPQELKDEFENRRYER